MLSGEPVGFLDHIKMYDDEDIDFFIHVDMSCSNSYVETVRNFSLEKSHVTFLNQIRGSWGDFSLVNIELLLLKKATQRDNYQYFHLMSGSDYLLKNPEEIKSFFNEHYPSNFVNFERECELDKKRPLFKLLTLKLPIQSKKLKYGISSRELQLRIFLSRKSIVRNKNYGLKFRKGSQWISITDKAARYILESSEIIENTFNGTLIPDELFVQSILYSSSQFRNTISGNNLRYIDWERGLPYVFKSSDLKELKKASDNWFIARKYSFKNVTN
ncbi:beta-1,6-N-acetylglucosaminyltransferase [Leuconostoc mesenteroides subsp. mesenteroides]